MNKNSLRKFAVNARKLLLQSVETEQAYTLFIRFVQKRFLDAHGLECPAIVPPVTTEELPFFQMLEQIDLPESEWQESVQLLGWLHQYYHAEPKDQVFSDLKRNIKVSAKTLPTATQLFTPEWIVQYLVDNALGRLWLEHFPESSLQEKLPCYLPETKPFARDGSLKPENIRLLDPCMGCGHILLYAFDVLLHMYRESGWNTGEAVRSILTRNLYGLDIDDRACQIGRISLLLKAAEYDRDILQEDIPLHLHLFHFRHEEDLPGDWTHAQLLGSLLKAENILLPAESSLFPVRKCLAEKYDVVITNPPYMGSASMNAVLSAFVREHYPTGKADLFACFMERCSQLTKEYGYYAMITMQSWMFLQRFEKLRRKLLRQDIVNLLHFGANAFEQSDVGTIVQTAAFVIRLSDRPEIPGRYVRLAELNQPEQKRLAIFEPERQYFVPKQYFAQIPGSLFAYWISSHALELFREQKLKDFAEPRQGMTTSDNHRFIRCWFEVNAGNICFHAHNRTEARDSGKTWFPYRKGGGYRKWYGNHLHIVNYQNDGEALKAFHQELNKTRAGGRLKNQAYYFRKSIAWTFIANTPGFRYCPEGFLFDVAGSSLFLEEEQSAYVLGLLCSPVTRYFLHLLNPTINIQANDIKSLPYRYADDPKIKELVEENIRLSQEDWDAFETSWDFQRHPLL